MNKIKCKCVYSRLPNGTVIIVPLLQQYAEIVVTYLHLVLQTLVVNL